MTDFARHTAAALAAVLIMAGSFGAIIAVPPANAPLVASAPVLA